ncbi:MAG: SCO1664 family protein [Actinomycetota bacterium]
MSSAGQSPAGSEPDRPDGPEDEDSHDDEHGVRLRLDPVDDPVEHLLRGEVEVEGRMPNSSNATMLVHVTHAGASHAAIYKPLRGERPLWDFEPGLHRREVATYRLSEALGLGVIPPTVLRDGPLGEGSYQWFVAADHRHHYFTILEEFPETHDALRDMAALDVLANNTDRKSGHVLVIPGDDSSEPTVWGIDNGLCFSAEFKLRTVIWDFADELLPEHVIDGANRLLDAVPIDVAALLSDDEVEAIQGRAAWMVKERRFPDDPSGRRWPWPLV